MVAFLSSPRGCFVAFASLSLLLSLSWPITLFFVGRPCRHLIWQWTKHELTYVVVHHVFFPIAVGLFAAYFDHVACLGRAPSIPILLWIVMAVLMVIISIHELATGSLLPYEMRHPCIWLRQNEVLSEVRQKKEMAEREYQDATSRNASQLALDQLRVKERDASTAYLRRQTRYRKWLRKQSVSQTLASCNAIIWVNFALTILYQLFCATVVWYAAVLAVNKNLNASNGSILVTISLLLSLWIPARAYANYFERNVGEAEVNDNSVAFAASISILMFVALFTVTVMAQVPDKAVDFAKAVGGILAASIVFVLKTFPELFSKVKGVIDALPFDMCLGICVVAFLLLIGIASP